MDLNVAIIGAASGIVSAGFAIAGFWMTLGGRIQKAESGAENALQTAAEAENDLKDMRTQHSALTAQFALYRETSIEKFVSHNVISELEKRLVENQAKSEQRLADALDGVNKRLDRLLEAGLRANRSS